MNISYSLPKKVQKTSNCSNIQFFSQNKLINKEYTQTNLKQDFKYH